MEKTNEIIPSKVAKIRWWLLTGALGDTLGVPTEMRKQSFITKKFSIVKDFLPTKHNLFFQKAWFKGDDIWYYSDDTVLTFAIAKSLTEIGGVDIHDIFKKQIEWYHGFPYGFGNKTKEAFEKIEQWISLEEITNPDSGWNGMMMKQFPLAAYFDIKWSDLESEEKAILDITKVSHGYPAALVAAVVHHHFLKKLLHADTQEINKQQILQELISIAQKQERKFEKREGKKISEVLRHIASYIDTKNEFPLSDQEIYEQFGRKDNMKQAWFITTTLWIVYCLFLRNTDMQWVRDAVNFGWDTDTYASIIGNMAGALHGEIYDEKLLDQIQNVEILKKQVNAFIYSLLWE